MDWVAFALLLSSGMAEETVSREAGPRIIHAQGAFCRIPHSSRKVIRDAELGEKVEVLGWEGNFAKVKVDGVDGFIHHSAFTADLEHKPGPVNEKDMEAKAKKGYEAGRFDPKTEKERMQLQPNLKPAYAKVDALQERQKWAQNRADLSARLDEFQKKGGLGEHVAVQGK